MGPARLPPFARRALAAVHRPGSNAGQPAPLARLQSGSPCCGDRGKAELAGTLPTLKKGPPWSCCPHSGSTDPLSGASPSSCPCSGHARAPSSSSKFFLGPTGPDLTPPGPCLCVYRAPLPCSVTSAQPAVVTHPVREPSLPMPSDMQTRGFSQGHKGNGDSESGCCLPVWDGNEEETILHSHSHPDGRGQRRALVGGEGGASTRLSQKT